MEAGTETVTFNYEQIHRAPELTNKIFIMHRIMGIETIFESAHYLVEEGKLDQLKDGVSRASLDLFEQANQETTLHTACRKGHLEIVQYLLAQGVDQSITNRKNYTAIQVATQYNHPEIVHQLYLAQNLSLSDVVEQQQLVILAALHNSDHVLTYLHAKDISFNQQDDNKKNAFEWAFSFGNKQAVKVFLASGYAPKNIDYILQKYAVDHRGKKTACEKLWRQFQEQQRAMRKQEERYQEHHTNLAWYIARNIRTIYQKKSNNGEVNPNSSFNSSDFLECLKDLLFAMLEGIEAFKELSRQLPIDHQWDNLGHKITQAMTHGPHAIKRDTLKQFYKSSEQSGPEWAKLIQQGRDLIQTVLSNTPQENTMTEVEETSTLLSHSKPLVEPELIEEMDTEAHNTTLLFRYKHGCLHSFRYPNGLDEGQALLRNTFCTEFSDRILKAIYTMELIAEKEVLRQPDEVNQTTQKVAQAAKLIDQNKVVLKAPIFKVDISPGQIIKGVCYFIDYIHNKGESARARRMAELFASTTVLDKSLTVAQTAEMIVTRFGGQIDNLTPKSVVDFAAICALRAVNYLLRANGSIIHKEKPFQQLCDGFYGVGRSVLYRGTQTRQTDYKDPVCAIIEGVLFGKSYSGNNEMRLLTRDGRHWTSEGIITRTRLVTPDGKIWTTSLIEEVDASKNLGYGACNCDDKEPQLRGFTERKQHGIEATLEQRPSVSKSNSKEVQEKKAQAMPLTSASTAVVPSSSLYVVPRKSGWGKLRKALGSMKKNKH